MNRRRFLLASLAGALDAPLARVAMLWDPTFPGLQGVFAALGFALLEPRTRELGLLHGWLDTWRGIGDVVVGMARQDYDLQLTRYDGRGWRATFYTSGMEHSATSAIGSAWDRTPWAAVQRAASEALAAAA